MANYTLRSQFSADIFGLCSIDVCHTKHDADDFTDHGQQCPSHEGDVLVAMEERKRLMNGKGLIETSNVFRIHGLCKMNMHELIMYIHDVFSFLANSYTPKQSICF